MRNPNHHLLTCDLTAKQYKCLKVWKLPLCGATWWFSVLLKFMNIYKLYQLDSLNEVKWIQWILEGLRFSSHPTVSSVQRTKGHSGYKSVVCMWDHDGVIHNTVVPLTFQAQEINTSQWCWIMKLSRPCTENPYPKLFTPVSSCSVIHSFKKT